ncbi:MAG: hypothetical protein ACHREM_19560 [Polyangiales bacterium]
MKAAEVRMSTKVRARAVLALITIAMAAGGALDCGGDQIPAGVRATVDTGGPKVVFDLSRLPLPEIPLPNDVATWPDPTSRTGRRINASLLAPSQIERDARAQFSQLEGFGTFSPISIPFDAPLDSADVTAHHVGDDYDFTDDRVYVVNLKTGVPVPLDVGGGNFPYTLKDLGRYGPNDPQKNESNLLFETREEDLNHNGVLDPGEDTDFDGVLDHPNFPGFQRPANGVDGLMTGYESESHTLIVRPMVPLDELTEYAVVVTDRLHGLDGKPVMSPFDDIHHPSQRASVQKLASLMASNAKWFGFTDDPTQHLAFVFTFTTQATTTDLFALRDGLYGRGRFAFLADQFLPQIKLFKAVGNVPPDQTDPSDWATSSEACTEQGPSTRSIAKYTPSMKSTFAAATNQLFGLSGPQGDRLISGYDSIAYLAIGTLHVPWLIGDVHDVSPGNAFDLDGLAQNQHPSSDDVPFFIVVPKTTADHKPPFPVSYYGHGYTGNGTEGLLYAADMARHGIAVIGMNAPGHGLVLDQGTQELATSLLGNGCLEPFGYALNINRTRPLLPQDPTRDTSGRDYWTAYLFHTRDMVRQAIVEQILMTKALRMFDGTTKYDWDGDGVPDLAGDFDRDGTPDFGGPNVTYTAWGESLGGILSMVLGGVDPHISATAPTSGGGALTDIGIRSFQGGVVEAVDHRIMGPLIITEPAEAHLKVAKDASGNPLKNSDGTPQYLPTGQQPDTACNPGDRTLRWLVVDLNATTELEIACLSPTALQEGDDLVVFDENNGESRCAKATSANSDYGGPDVHIGIPTSVGDPIDIGIYRPLPGEKQVVTSYGKHCLAPQGRLPVHVVSSWQGVGQPCSTIAGASCLTFQGNEIETDPTGLIFNQLFAPVDGYGVRRQTPDYRKFMQLAQIALEPADPISFAPYYALKPRTMPEGPEGTAAPPTALLTINTIGDMNVPVNSGIAFARTSGAIPFLRSNNVLADKWADYVAPDQLVSLYGMTPNEVLLQHHVIEGISRLGRTPAGSKCAPNYSTAVSGCTGATTYSDPSVCANALFDAEYISDGLLPYGQQHSATPLRLARLASAGELGALWSPRLATPSSPSGPLVSVMNLYVVPDGVHGFDPPDPCKLWDDGMYMLNVLSHFFRTGGSDLYYLSNPTTHECAAVTDPSKGCDWKE